MKGKKEHSKIYCTKDDTRTGKQWKRGFDFDTPFTAKDPLHAKTLYPWQQECLNIVKSEPHERQIHWYIGDGCNGKTVLAKHLALQGNTLVVNGKQADVMHGIAKWVESNKRGPNIVIWIAPRDHTEYINYGALECIKDGLFYSGKYDSTMVIYDTPHLLVFCNIMPEPGKLTKDRIILHELKGYSGSGAPAPLTNEVGKPPSDSPTEHAPNHRFSPLPPQGGDIAPNPPGGLVRPTLKRQFNMIY